MLVWHQHADLTWNDFHLLLYLSLNYLLWSYDPAFLHSEWKYKVKWDLPAGSLSETEILSHMTIVLDAWFRTILKDFNRFLRMGQSWNNPKFYQ